MIPSHFSNYVTNCKILHDATFCTSDHYPIYTKMNLKFLVQEKANGTNVYNLGDSVCKYPIPEWKNSTFVLNYRNNISSSLSNLKHIDLGHLNRQGAQNLVNKYSEDLIKIIHNAVLKSKTKSFSNKRRRKHWWDTSCTIARDKLKFWFSIWKSCGRPRQGHIYECYKSVKYKFRNACRTSVNEKIIANLNNCDNLYKQRNMSSFWNVIKQLRKNKSTKDYECISLDKFVTYFENKFSYNTLNENDFIHNLRGQVEQKYDQIVLEKYDFTFSEYLVKKFVHCLKPNSAPGGDGVTAEHLRFASDTSLMLHLCRLFTICFTYGVVPSGLTKGILVPILKKSSLDPTLAKSHRPVILSSTFSKLIEMYIMYKNDDFIFNDCQFGFIKSRGTVSAVSVVHDVGTYCVQNGSQMYICSLDAEGAFDAIPHPVLFAKTLNVISNMSWRLLYCWYTDMTINIKWKYLSRDIPMCKGTKQGGLCSPFLFNIFYKGLIDHLNSQNGGVTIGKYKYNAFCYADDVLLTITTVSGLQSVTEILYYFVCDLLI